MIIWPRYVQERSYIIFMYYRDAQCIHADDIKYDEKASNQIKGDYIDSADVRAFIRDQTTGMTLLDLRRARLPLSCSTTLLHIRYIYIYIRAAHCRVLLHNILAARVGGGGGGGDG